MPDEVMIRIGHGIELGRRGEPAAARTLLTEPWEELGPDGDAFHRCALAHSLADVQDDVHEELLWDLRALAAADLVDDERLRLAGVASPVLGFYPSLHLNLAEAYRRIGDLDLAREHLAQGRAAVVALTDDAYGEMIKGGLDRLEERLTAPGPE